MRNCKCGAPFKLERNQSKTKWRATCSKNCGQVRPTKFYDDQIEATRAWGQRKQPE